MKDFFVMLLGGIKAKSVPFVWKFIGVILGGVFGFVLLGLRYGVVVGGAGPAYVEKTWHLDILWGPVGFVMFGVIGHLVSIHLYHREVKPSPVMERRDRSARSVVWFFVFLFLALVLWIVAMIVVGQVIELWRGFQLNLIGKAFAVLSILISWLLVGYRVRWPGRFTDWIMRGVFNYIRLPFLNSHQVKTLWIMILLLFFLLVFPPWRAYTYELDNQGGGPSYFAGFHFLGSDEFDVRYEKPFMVAKVDGRLQVFLLVVVVVCGFGFMVFFWSRKLRPYMAILVITLLWGLFTGISVGVIKSRIDPNWKAEYQAQKTRDSLFALRMYVEAEIAKQGIVEDALPKGMAGWLELLLATPVNRFVLDEMGMNIDYEKKEVYDGWGMPIQFVVKLSGEYAFVSFGPNRRDDGGGEDDMVEGFELFKVGL